MVSKDAVWRALGEVQDPEYPLSIVDLGMIYSVALNGPVVKVAMTFTAIGCPAIDMIAEDVRTSVMKVPGISELELEVVWSPPWTKDKISDKGREILRYYGVVT